MKLGIIVGHTKTSPGAFSPELNSSEFPWNDDLAQKILSIDSTIERKIFYRSTSGIAGVEAAYKASDDWGSNITTELHFNSSHSQSATGTGILYLAGSLRGKRFAQLLFKEIGAVLKLPEWPSGTGGIATPFQASGKQMRGQGSLSAGRAPATLIEPFFGSNPSDSKIAQKHKVELAAAIVRAAEAF